jgi:hypothetical protein
MSTLVIVPCGQQKVWDKNFMLPPTSAQDAYTSTLFRLHRRFAESRGACWWILSAKYGWLWPDTPIEDYDRKFTADQLNQVCSLTRDFDHLRWSNRAAAMLSTYRDRTGIRIDRVVLLGGWLYREVAKRELRNLGLTIEEPFAGLDLFQTMKALKGAQLSN